MFTVYVARYHNAVVVERGLVAQRLEQAAHNRLVVGSNPTGATTDHPRLYSFLWT